MSTCMVACVSPLSGIVISSSSIAINTQVNETRTAEWLKEQLDVGSNNVLAVARARLQITIDQCTALGALFTRPLIGFVLPTDVHCLRLEPGARRAHGSKCGGGRRAHHHQHTTARSRFDAIAHFSPHRSLFLSILIATFELSPHYLVG